MSETEFQVVKSVGFVSALLIAIALQRISPHAKLRGSWRTNGSLWLTNAVVIGLVCTGCACAVSRWAAQGGIGLFNNWTGPGWLELVVSVMAIDLVAYLWHRANHRVGLLWRFHQVHHSDPNFTVTTALRFHPGELLLALPVRLVAVALIGVSVPAVIVFEVIFALANSIEHGDIDLPSRFESALDRLFVTPALHRRHHSRDRSWLDSNFGTIFSLWDRALGTFGSNASGTSVRTGLAGAPEQAGPLDVMLMPSRLIGR